jgi:hypothetical protein
MVDRCALKGTTFATCLARNNKKKNGCLIVCPKLIIATETNAVQPRLWMLTLGGFIDCVNWGECQWKKNSYCTCVIGGRGLEARWAGLVMDSTAPVIAELCLSIDKIEAEMKHETTSNKRRLTKQKKC